jgi:hypothetical protein
MHFYRQYVPLLQKLTRLKKDAGLDGKVETAANACIALTCRKSENCYGAWYGALCLM